MTKTPINLQDLRKRIYIKAKAEKTCRFWGIYEHVCKKETLQKAYELVKRNKGTPGIDRETFEAIETGGLEEYLEGIRRELISQEYYPKRNRKIEIPKENGKTRTLGIPTIRDRIVQSALKLVIEPIFEADFQEGSYGYRPKRKPQEAVKRVAKAIISQKTTVIDVDLKSYFDTIRHDILLEKVAQRINDNRIMKLLKKILKAGGKRGVSQGGVISPLLANLYLNEVDKMLERAKEVTRQGKYTTLEYARWADDLVILIDGNARNAGITRKVKIRLKEEVEKLDVEINEEKTRELDMKSGDTFTFMGFEFRRIRTRRGKWGLLMTPKPKSRTKLLNKLTEIFERYQSQSVKALMENINPIIRGWVNYFRNGNSSRCFSYVKDWIEKKVRRHLMRARQKTGFGWKRWSRDWLYEKLGLYGDYRLQYL
jgi:RNA-directed DNA polymerase